MSSSVAELRYMLDTNVVSELVRRPDGEVVQRVVALAPDSLAISIIVAAELRYGAERRGSARLTRQLEAVLSALEVLPLEEPADRLYGVIRSELERLGRPIGHNDLLIAAHARASGTILVTEQCGRIHPRARPHGRELAAQSVNRRSSKQIHGDGAGRDHEPVCGKRCRTDAWNTFEQAIFTHIVMS